MHYSRERLDVVPRARVVARAKGRLKTRHTLTRDARELGNTDFSCPEEVEVESLSSS